MAKAVVKTVLETPALAGAVSLMFVLWVVSGLLTLPGLRKKLLPPGPPTIPFLGNLHLMPRTGIHLQFTKWAKSYGPIFSLKIGHGTMVVLSSAFHATQLLDKRSSQYSDRPPSYVVGDLVFNGDHPMFMNADERWKLRRKLYFQMLQESRCNKEHTKLIEAETTQLIRDICMEPDNLMLHPGRMSNSITMSLVYGIRTPSYNTPHYLDLQKIMTELSAFGEIGATPPVDLLSILKYIPEKLWGNWKSRAADLRKAVIDLHSPLVDQVLERREKIGSASSFLDGVFDQQDKLGLTRNEIDIMCGNLLEGGTDTMATTLLSLCQIMATYPEWLVEAQKEIDAVVDEYTLPSWEHFEQLPLVSMIVKEILRWRPPAPGAFPHALTKDDEIEGMKIPKGSTVIFNIWGMHHDPERYPDPEKFDPSRFRDHPELASVYANSGHEKRDHFAYGAGRRICPGIHLAERALFLGAARILWAFSIQHKLGTDGKQIPIDLEPATAYKDGFLNQCHPFEVDIRVRSEKRREAILAAVAKADVDVFSGYL